MPKSKSVYKIVFVNTQGTIYEIYAKCVNEAPMLGFIEVSDMIFGESSSVVVDPSEEKLKNEFKNVSCTYLPIQAVLRIDVVEKEGKPKITSVSDADSKVSPFPTSLFPNPVNVD